MTLPQTGHDGPYPAPVEVSKSSVLYEWIDYNGHMNVGYYGLAFDQALDVLLSDHLGIGVEYVRIAGQGPYVLQSHQHYLKDQRLGDRYTIRFRLIDCDAKRLHIFGEMLSDPSGEVCATQELMLMNVDHQTGRSAAYPGWAVQRLAQMKADHSGLARPSQLGAGLGIRRRG